MRGTSTPWTRRAARVAAVALGVAVLSAAVPVAHVGVAHVRTPVQADAQWLNASATTGSSAAQV